MKERPILFNGAMVRAILDGTKTQTRRAGKPVRHPDLGNLYTLGALVLEHEPQHVIERACPIGQTGDRLWVRETFMREPHPAEVGLTREMIPRTWDAACAAAGTIHYAADPGALLVADGRPWTPSIHMPRAASRILLEIVSVRIERLQDISEADAAAEGVKSCEDELDTHGNGYANSELFSILWSKTYGMPSWHANPWVWVVEFKQVAT